MTNPSSDISPARATHGGKLISGEATSGSTSDEERISDDSDWEVVPTQESHMHDVQSVGSISPREGIARHLQLREEAHIHASHAARHPSTFGPSSDDDLAVDVPSQVEPKMLPNTLWTLMPKDNPTFKRSSESQVYDDYAPPRVIVDDGNYRITAHSPSNDPYISNLEEGYIRTIQTRCQDASELKSQLEMAEPLTINERRLLDLYRARFRDDEDEIDRLESRLGNAEVQAGFVQGSISSIKQTLGSASDVADSKISAEEIIELKRKLGEVSRHAEEAQKSLDLMVRFLSFEKVVSGRENDHGPWKRQVWNGHSDGTFGSRSDASQACGYTYE